MKSFYKFLLWFSTLLFICFYGCTHTLAWTSDGGITYEGVAYLTDSTTVSIEADYDTPGGGTLELQPNTTYQTRIKKLFIEVEGYNFVANRQYQLELHFEGIQLNQNANTYKVYAWNTATLSNDLCMISYEETIMSSDAYPRWNFQCPNTSSDIVIHVYNSNDSAITQTGAFRWSYSYLWYSNQSIGSGNDDIIDNSNQNADRIINNQNENTDKMIDSQRVCDTVITSYSDSINKQNALNGSTGKLSSNQHFNTTDYIPISSETVIKILNSQDNYTTRVCFYNNDKQYISCPVTDGLPVNTIIQIPNNAKYIRASIHTSNLPILEIKTCKDGNQAISDDLKDLNDSLTDDTPISVDSLGNTIGWLPPGPIDSIINMPLNMLNGLMTALNSTCSPLNVPLPYVNKTLTIPCLDTIFNQITGLPAFWTWVGVIASVLILYKYFIALYNYYDKATDLQAQYLEDFGGTP